MIVEKHLFGLIRRRTSTNYIVRKQNFTVISTFQSPDNLKIQIIF